MRRLQLIAYCVTLFSFILQVGKHFWPTYSFIDGIRVDYLSPTLYFSDIALVVLFIVYFLDSRKRRNLRVTISHHQNIILLPLFFLVMLFSAFLAKTPQEAWLGVLKLLEMGIFAYITAQEIGKNKLFMLVIWVLVISSSIVSLIAYFQFYFQHNVGGLLYFLGERTFTISTGGIAKFDMFGTSVLRPYATFPHPNVLACFLLVVITLELLYFRTAASSRERLILFVSMMLNSTTLLLSFSRIVLIVFFVGIFAVLWRQQRFSRWLLIVSVGVLSLLVLGLELRITNTVLFARDILLRVKLLSIAGWLIQHHLWLGVGLNNFLYYEATLQKQFSPIFLQPVHNIYLLIFAQMGIVGLFCSLYFILRTIQRLRRSIINTVTSTQQQYYQFIGYLFIGGLVIGIFDHYLLTLQQGQLLAAFLTGLAWSKKAQ